MSKIKIAISGIGAVGGYYGGLLAAYYQNSEEVEIFFISRGENLQAIRKDGLEIKKSFKKITAIPTLATDDPTEIGPVDYLFCCTKSYDLEDNIRDLAPVIGPDTIIIPLLNGADISERIQQIVPDNKVWKGCVYIGSRLVSPGHVQKFTLKDRLFFGHNSKDKEKQVELQKLLSSARILSTNPADIDFEIWKKFFMISTAATITSYFNETINEVIDKHIDLFITLGYELQSVAEAKGIKLPEDIVFSSIKSQQMMPNGSTTSMHTDFRRGSKTEIETLTGYVIREAEALKLEVPTYQFMYKGLTQFPYPR
ncbi:2-dehydropantoate 2-reductase [Parabacteroides sp. TM07-1AC]|uniref:ketopantoate reductase family protein n=1 Tax=Parabacteroides sp. TM07-1AC TaxID=2292363 RepID=UPI000EFE84F2|nr:2-dehydropantoate 2-reductase [Parabacteroides sp. TM07-1AC]RHU27263.1 2-dehydropantoate 2-reductase [Parabacteroides sp. TM07-1AC]